MLGFFRSWPRAARITVYVTTLTVLVASAAAAAVLVSIRRSFPQTSGTLEVAGLVGDVRVVRDGNGIPRIYADDVRDLFFAQGYVQAQDRFWQMDAARHHAGGRLAELVGSEALASDKVMRTLGLRAIAEQELDLLDPDTRAKVEDFSGGVTAYLRTHADSEMSLEYAVLALHGLDYKAEPWTAVDTLMYLKALAWELDTSASAERDRAILAARFTPAQIDQIAAPAASTWRAWVVGPERTASGLPILATDLQLPVSLPSRGYQMGLHCAALTDQCPYDVTGISIPGLPGVLAGRNGNVAWGIADNDADVSDLFLEQVEDHSYLRDGVWVPLEEREETIEIAGERAFTYTARRTVHGPLLSDVAVPWARAGANAAVPEGSPERGSGYAVAVSSPVLAPDRTMAGLLGLARATSWEEFRAAASEVGGFSWTLLYADTSGSIGYQATGTRPLRGHALGQSSGESPRPGWSAAYDALGVLPAESLPHGLDVGPEIVLAAADTPRVRDRLAVSAADGALGVAEMSAIQADSWNRLAPVLVPYLLDIELTGFDAIGQRLLRAWDFTQPVDSAAAAYFNAVYRNILLLAFNDDLPGDLAPHDDGAWAEIVATLVQEPSSAWWDDQRSEDVVEDRDAVLRQAMLDARDETIRMQDRNPARWRWGHHHGLDLKNLAFDLRGSWLGAKLLNRGGTQLPGSGASVSAARWDPQDPYRIVRAPAIRMVVSLADTAQSEESAWVSLTGVSGHAFSDYYTDQTKAYAAGTAVPLHWAERPGRTLTLVPARTE